MTITGTFFARSSRSRQRFRAAAVECGQAEIEQDDVRPRRDRGAQRVEPVQGRDDLEPGLSERDGEHLADDVIVFDDHHQKMWNDLGRSQSFTLLCGYPIGAFQPSQAADRRGRPHAFAGRADAGAATGRPRLTSRLFGREPGAGLEPAT